MLMHQWIDNKFLLNQSKCSFIFLSNFLKTFFYFFRFFFILIIFLLNFLLVYLSGCLQRPAAWRFFCFLLFASYSLALSAHSTSTVNAVIIRIRLLGPLRHDVWPPYPLGISSFWGQVSAPLSAKLLPVYTDLWSYVRYVPLFLSIHRSECCSRLPFSRGYKSTHNTVISNNDYTQTIWCIFCSPSPGFEPGTPTLI